MENINYIRTDLASECSALEEKNCPEGISYSEFTRDGATVSSIEILDERGEEALGKPIGNYITVSFGRIWQEDDDSLEKIKKIIAGEIRSLALKMTETKNGQGEKSVLIAGLGNRYITPDAIGPQCIHGIEVTRHIHERDVELFGKLHRWNISAITPGVIGQTGIESGELIKSAGEHVRPDLIIVIDALASRSVDRLASTVQLSDSGISPGSGIGNKCKAITEKELGIPVMAIGVPTMVDSSTLVYDALEKAGIRELSPELREVLNNGKSFFVTLNESDIVISALSKLLSDSINAAFSNNN